MGGRRAVYICKTSFSRSSSQGEHLKSTKNEHTGDKDATFLGEKIEWNGMDRREGALQGPANQNPFGGAPGLSLIGTGKGYLHIQQRRRQSPYSAIGTVDRLEGLASALMPRKAERST